MENKILLPQGGKLGMELTVPALVAIWMGMVDHSGGQTPLKSDEVDL
jgi:hypothetical protein